MRSEIEGAPINASERSSTHLQSAKRLLPYLGVVVVIGTALLLALLIKAYLFVANVALIFVAGVVLCAVRWGLQPALAACALSVLALNYFVFPPLHDLAVEDPENVVAVVVFVAVAVFVGRLTAEARRGTTLAESRARVTEELYAFARRLATIDDLDELLEVTARHLAASLSAETVLLLPEREVLTVRAAVPLADELDPEDLAEAERTLASEEGDAHPFHYLFLPLRAPGGIVGVIGIARAGRPADLAVEQLRFVEAIADQAAVAVKRLTLAVEVERARVTAETEKLRATMLSAISHDLKTPLASILGAATSLGSYSSYFEQQEREDLIATIREEAERMSRFIRNLLDITRVQSGTLEVRNEPTDIEEVVGAAVRRARQILGGRRLELHIAPDLPLLDLDAVLLEQVLFNLLDNAAKYSPPSSTVQIEARHAGERILIRVLDEGPGIRPDERERIFEKFYRSRQSGRQLAGTGLGLTICRSFVEAMGGWIIAGNRTDRSGAVFIIGFLVPKGATAQAIEEVDDD